MQAATVPSEVKRPVAKPVAFTVEAPRPGRAERRPGPAATNVSSSRIAKQPCQVGRKSLMPIAVAILSGVSWLSTGGLDMVQGELECMYAVIFPSPV